MGPGDAVPLKPLAISATVVPEVSSSGHQPTIPDGGGTQDTTVTAWLHVLLFPHVSVTIQVRVMTLGQTPLVTVPSTAIVKLVPQQEGVAVGGSKVQVETQVTVLLLTQVRVGGMVQALEQHCVRVTLSICAPPTSPVLGWRLNAMVRVEELGTKLVQ
jgi:hypothetical protein